jgi:hypothetical protein
MTTHSRGETLAVAAETAKVVSGVGLFDAVLLVGADRDADRLQALPLRTTVKMRRGRDLIVMARFQAAVTLLHFDMTADRAIREVVSQVTAKAPG